MKRNDQEKESKLFELDENDMYRPRSIELETEFIHQLVKSPGLMEFCYGVITKDDLTEDGPKEVYSTMLKLHERTEKWNHVTLKSEVSNQEEYSPLFNDLPTETDSDVFANLVKNLKTTTVRRKLHSFLYRTFNSIWERDPQEISAETMTFISDLDIRLSKKELKNLKPTVIAHIELMKRRYKGETVGITTGFPDLDFLLGQGLKKKEVVVPAARPGVGKTSFCTSVALNAANAGHKVLFITMEMDDLAIMDKLLSFQSNVPLTQITRGKAPKDKVKIGYERLRGLPLTVKFLPNPSSAEIYSIASKHKYVSGLDLLVVDYLGLTDKDSSNDEVQRLGRTMMNFKSLANMLDCTVLVPHQLNRKIENRSKDQKDPLLSDLRGSGNIEEHAAVVLFLTRETIGDKASQVRVRVAKNRYGETGIVDLHFNTFTTKFESI